MARGQNRGREKGFPKRKQRRGGRRRRRKTRGLPRILEASVGPFLQKREPEEKEEKNGNVREKGRKFRKEKKKSGQQPGPRTIEGRVGSQNPEKGERVTKRRRTNYGEKTRRWIFLGGKTRKVVYVYFCF